MKFSFFRKYNRLIMVFGGSILMVMFLLPNVDMFQPSRGDQVHSTTKDGEITIRMLNQASGEMAILRSLAGRGLRQYMPPQFADDSELYWHLLWNEARREGVYMSASVAMRMINDHRTRDKFDFQPILERHNITLDTIVVAIQHLQEIYQYLQMSSMKSLKRVPTFQGISAVRRVSEPHLRQVAKDYIAKANIELVAIDADHVIKDIADPTAEELDSRFKQNKEDKVGESRYGFGYYQPNKFKIEYLAIDFEAVATSLVKLEETDLLKYYDANKKDFINIDAVPDAPGEDDKTKEGEAKEEEKPKPKSLYKPYEEVRDSIIEKMRSTKAAELQRKIAQYVQARLNEHRRRLETDERGYIQLPADYKPLSMKEVAADVQTHPQFKGYLPTYIEINKWRDAEQLKALQGFGEATLAISTNSLPVATYINSVKELGGKESGLSALRLQQNVAGQVVSDTKQNLYIFRVTDIEKAHVPKSIDEADIKTQVAKDVKRLKAYTKLTETLKDKVLAEAKADGLKKVSDEYGVLSKTIAGISRSDKAEKGILSGIKSEKYDVVGNSTVFVEAVADVMNKVDAAGGLDKLKPEDQFGVVAVDKNQKLAVFRITEYNGVTLEQYHGRKVELASYVDFLEKAALFEREKNPSIIFNNMPSLDDLKARSGFALADPPEEEEEKTGEGANEVQASENKSSEGDNPADK